MCWMTARWQPHYGRGAEHTMHEMTAGDLRVSIDEATGGAIDSFSHAGFALLRPVADFRLEAEHGRAVGAYPLIPYANRVANGRFSFGGEDFQLGLNFAGHPHSLHGNAWMRVWDVVSATPARVHLALDHRPPADPVSQWPFAYRAELVFALDARGPDGGHVRAQRRCAALSGRDRPAPVRLAGAWHHAAIRCRDCVAQWGRRSAAGARGGCRPLGISPRRARSPT